MRNYGPDHPASSNGLANLGKVLMDQGRFEEAAAPIRRASEIRRASSTPDNYSRIAVEMNLAGLELALGDLEQAIALYRSGLERFERLTGPESGPSTRVRGLLGVALHQAGDVSSVEPLLRRAYETEVPGVGAVNRAELLVGLGAVVSDRGRAAEAEPLLREALALFLEDLPPDHWKVAGVRVELAGALLRREASSSQGRDEADQLLHWVEGLDLERHGFLWLGARTAAFRAQARR